MRRWLPSIVLLALASTPASSAEPPCPGPTGTEALSQYLANYAACFEEKRDETSDTKKRTEEMQAASPASPPAAGFASQLRSSLENYLDVFSFAIDGVTASDDDKALTIRFNPIRSGAIGSLGLSVTATEPAASDRLLAGVAEGSRATVREALETGLDETDNLTFKASFGFERKASKHDRWLLGRSHKNYESLVEDDLLPTFGSFASPSPELADRIDDCEDAAADRLVSQNLVDADFDGNVQAIEIDLLEQALESSFASCLTAWKEAELLVIDADEKLDALVWLPFLIDNQPQLSLAAEIHERAKEVGRNGWNVKLSYEKGFNNLNTLLRRTAGKEGPEWADAFFDAVGDLSEEEVEAENKMTFSVTYVEHDPYSFTRVIGEGDTAVTVESNLKRAKEVCGKFEYHRNFTAHSISVNDQTVYPKLHLSLEYIDVSDDPMRRDKLVGLATYEIPLPSGMAFPISLSYANHTEFLGEPDERLSAHFGLSYKLPNGDG